MKLLPLVEGWDGACSGLDGPLVELLPLGEGWDGASSGNSVGVAISRRRYTQSYYFHQPIFDNYPAMGNAYG